MYKWVALMLFVLIALPIFGYNAIVYLGGDAVEPPNQTWDEYVLESQTNLIAAYPINNTGVGILDKVSGWFSGLGESLFVSSLGTISPALQALLTLEDADLTTQQLSLTGRIYSIPLRMIDFLFGDWLLEWAWPFISNVTYAYNMFLDIGIHPMLVILVYFILLWINILIIIKHLPTT